MKPIQKGALTVLSLLLGLFLSFGALLAPVCLLLTRPGVEGLLCRDAVTDKAAAHLDEAYATLFLNAGLTEAQVRSLLPTTEEIRQDFANLAADLFGESAPYEEKTDAWFATRVEAMLHDAGYGGNEQLDAAVRIYSEEMYTVYDASVRRSYMDRLTDSVGVLTGLLRLTVAVDIAAAFLTFLLLLIFSLRLHAALFGFSITAMTAALFSGALCAAGAVLLYGQLLNGILEVEQAIIRCAVSALIVPSLFVVAGSLLLFTVFRVCNAAMKRKRYTGITV